MGQVSDNFFILDGVPQDCDNASILTFKCQVFASRREHASDFLIASTK